MKLREREFAVIAALVFIVIMNIMERTVAPAYWVKSLVKVSVILLILFSYSAIYRKPWRETVWFRKMKPAKTLFIFMGAVFLVLVAAFLLLRNALDFAAIRESLVTKERLTKENCLFVFSYIALVNSFLEEALFRGCLYHAFTERNVKMPGLVFSSSAFAAYHIGIVDTWLDPWMLALCIAGLMAAGFFLQLVCERYDSVKASWLVHGCANLAIDALGVVVIFFY